VDGGILGSRRRGEGEADRRDGGEGEAVGVHDLLALRLGSVRPDLSPLAGPVNVRSGAVP
jgi:hypothetical protein